MIDWLIIYKNVCGKATESEKLEYDKWLKSASIHKLYSDRVLKYHEKNGEFIPLSDAELSTRFDKLTSAIEDRSREDKFKKSKKRSLKLLISSVAVAAAILTVSFLIRGGVDENLQPLSVVNNEITVPTLILDNGENIEFNSISRTERKGSNDKIEVAKILQSNQNNESNKSSDEEVINKVVVPSLYTFTIILDDSTEVTLNANSQLSYPVKFLGETRRVTLKGEAYFKVKKGSKPFIVNTDDISVKVYGTEFNINTNRIWKVETVLVSGEIGITCPRLSDMEIKMIPNQKHTLNIYEGGGSFIMQVVNVHDYIGWIDGFFKFDNQPLRDICQEISNWYGIKFECNNREIMNMLVSLKFQRATTSLDNVLSVIGEITQAVIIKTGKNTYVIE